MLQFPIMNFKSSHYMLTHCILYLNNEEFSYLWVPMAINQEKVVGADQVEAHSTSSKREQHELDRKELTYF